LLKPKLETFFSSLENAKKFLD